MHNDAIPARNTIPKLEGSDRSKVSGTSLAFNHSPSWSGQQAKEMNTLKLPMASTSKLRRISLPTPSLLSTERLHISSTARKSGGSLSNSPRSAYSELDENQSLNEALREAMQPDESLFTPSSLITRPPLAHLASHTAARDFHSPRLLTSLARTTLPTSSLTAFPDRLYSEHDKTSAGGNSRPQHSRSSIDSLRSLSSRGIHTTPSTLQRPSSPSRWWFQSDNKKVTDRLLDEDDRASTASEEIEKIRKKYFSPKNPVVFCHGLLGFDFVSIGPVYPLQVSHWRGIKEALEANGVEVLITRVPATSSIEERAEVLEKTISDTYPHRSVHLIGHSMGGLDCRYLVAHLKMRTFKVLSVTTIATPHRGSAFADYFLSTIGHERIPSIVSLLDMLPNGGGDGSAFTNLTVEYMRKFNEETPDVHGVRYLSWGAECTPGLLDPFRFPHSVILEREGPNDGLVSVDSAKWGTYLGTLADVNHLDLIGWINNTRYKWAEFMGKEIKFKPATFYLGVADYLAKSVEGQGSDPDGTTTSTAGEQSGAVGSTGGGPPTSIPMPGVQLSRSSRNNTAT